MEENHYSHSSATHHGGGHHPASTTELMGSAKVVAEAAKSAFTHHSAAGIDKARVAEAAEDLLDAAKQYGKLEGSGFGQYLDKAEGYLHNLHSSSPATHVAEVSSTATQLHLRQEHRPARFDEDEEDEESRPSGGGIGDYMKMAQGFLK